MALLIASGNLGLRRMRFVDWGSKSVAAGDSAHEVAGNEEADDDGAVRAEVDIREEATS